MNIDVDKIHAAASATLCRRYFCVRSLVVAAALAGTMLPALAGPKDKERDEPRQNLSVQREAKQEMRQEIRQQRIEAARQPEQRQYEQRQFDGRAFENQDQRRQQQMQEQNARAEALRRNGRMTADERRDLRRQINEAGLDIYPNTPRR